MNEPDKAVGAEENAEDPVDIVRRIRAEILPYDPVLESLVALVNLMDTVEISITLHVKGSVVSGMLISARSYYNLLVHQLKESDGGEFLAEFYEPTLQEQKDAREKYQAEQTPPPRPLHTHLRQAATYVTGANEPLNTPLWRGRLTEVDAWSLGSHGPPPPPLPADLAV